MQIKELKQLGVLDMFSKLKTRWLSSIKYRLSVFYTFVFSIFFVTIFCSLLLFTKQHLYTAKDHWIYEETKEMATLFDKVPLSQLQKHMQEESYFAGINNIFYSLRHKNGKVILSSDTTSFQKVESLQFPPPEKTHYFQTITTSDNSFRVLNLAIDSDNFLQCAISLKEQMSFLSNITITFFVVYIIIILFIYKMSLKIVASTLKPIDTITKVANEISKKDLGYTIPIKNNKDELGRLATTLNQMFSRIDTLVTELKKMNADLAHDLRTIMSRILINLEVFLLQDNLQDKKNLEIANEDCKYLISVLNQVLDISEIETGIIPIKNKCFSLNDYISKLVDVFDDIAFHKGINFSVTNYFENAQLFGDRKKLEIAFANILDNAFKYTSEKGEVSISICEESGKIKIEVIDSGQGIDPADIPFIFNRFYRSDKARTLNGSGLGLAQSKAIIEAHGGDILVHSQKNIGTTFTIFLPVKQ